MSLKERVYSVLVVSAAEKLNTLLAELLPESHYDPVRTVSSISAAKRAWSENESRIGMSLGIPRCERTIFKINSGLSKPAELMAPSAIHVPFGKLPMPAHSVKSLTP